MATQLIIPVITLIQLGNDDYIFKWFFFYSLTYHWTSWYLFNQLAHLSIQLKNFIWMDKMFCWIDKLIHSRTLCIWSNSDDTQILLYRGLVPVTCLPGMWEWVSHPCFFITWGCFQQRLKGPGKTGPQDSSRTINSCDKPFWFLFRRIPGNRTCFLINWSEWTEVTQSCPTLWPHGL